MKRIEKVFVITVIQPSAITGLATVLEAIAKNDQKKKEMLKEIDMMESSAVNAFDSDVFIIML